MFKSDYLFIHSLKILLAMFFSTPTRVLFCCRHFLALKDCSRSNEVRRICQTLSCPCFTLCVWENEAEWVGGDCWNKWGFDFFISLVSISVRAMPPFCCCFSLTYCTWSPVDKRTMYKKCCRFSLHICTYWLICNKQWFAITSFIQTRFSPS